MGGGGAEGVTFPTGPCSLGDQGGGGEGSMQKMKR